MIKVTLFSIFVNLWCLSRRVLNFYICWSIQSVAMCCFGGGLWTKFWLTKRWSWKRKDCFMTLSDYCRYSSLILHWNLTSTSFLKVSRNHSMTLDAHCNKYYRLFSLEWQVHIIHIWEKVCQMSKSESPWFVCLLFLQVKLVFHEKGS